MRAIEHNLTLRILTQPYRGHEHQYNGQIIRCGGSKCPMCLLPHYPTDFFVIGAIDRADNNYYAFRFDRNFYYAIRALVGSPDWGDPEGYDIVVAAKPGSGFNAFAMPKTELTAHDQEIKNNLDILVLAEAIQPYPVDCVKGFMRRNRVVADTPDYLKRSIHKLTERLENIRRDIAVDRDLLE